MRQDVRYHEDKKMNGKFIPQQKITIIEFSLFPFLFKTTLKKKLTESFNMIKPDFVYIHCYTLPLTIFFGLRDYLVTSYRKLVKLI